MKCLVCGETLAPQITDMPFNLSARTILILKDLPALQGENCGESATLDPVMEKVDSLLANRVQAIALEIVRFEA